MNKTPIRIELTRDGRAELQSRTRSHCLTHRDVARAKMVLLLADGKTLSSIERKVGKTRKIVRKWGKRFVEKQMDGLVDKSGRGRVPVFSPGGGHGLVKLACELPDRVGRSLSLWTCAELARTAVERGIVNSISPQSVQRILRAIEF